MYQNLKVELYTRALLFRVIYSVFYGRSVIIMRNKNYVPLNYADFLPDKKGAITSISDGLSQILKYVLVGFLGLSTFGLGFKYIRWLFK